LLTVGAPVAAHAAAGASALAALAAMQAARQHGSGGAPRTPKPNPSPSGKRPKISRKAPSRWKQHTVQAGLVLGGLAALAHGAHSGNAVEMAAGVHAISAAPVVTNPARDLRGRLPWILGTGVTALGSAKLAEWGFNGYSAPAFAAGTIGWAISAVTNLLASLTW
jgi:hypothetical protein